MQRLILSGGVFIEGIREYNYYYKNLQAQNFDYIEEEDRVDI